MGLVYSDHYSNHARSCQKEDLLVTNVIAFDKKHLGITFFINAGVTNVLFDEIDDPAIAAVLYIVIQPLASCCDIILMRALQE